MPNRILRDYTASEKIDSLSFEAECLFVRMLTKADDFGIYTANPVLLKAYCFPLKTNLRTTMIARLIDECEKAGIIVCYDGADGKRYTLIRGFRQFVRNKKSKYPIPPKGVIPDEEYRATFGDVPKETANGTQMQSGCDTDELHMQCNCTASEMQMQSGCDTDELHMQCNCTASEMQMQSGCDAIETHACAENETENETETEKETPSGNKLPSGAKKRQRGCYRIGFGYEDEKPDFCGITEERMQVWHECYPAVELTVELGKMRGWLLSHKNQRKINVEAFITNWFKRVQDRSMASMRNDICDGNEDNPECYRGLEI